MKEYLEWERQATVMPILMCMEAWTAPTTKYFGEPWPITYIKYDGDVVSWYTRMDGLHKFGQMVIDEHVKKGGMEKFEKEARELAKEFDKLFREFYGFGVEDLSDSKLMSLFQRIHSLYIDWFVLGAVCEPVGIRGEHLVSELVKHFKNPDKAISLLTTTTRKSFSKRELEEMLKIAVHKRKGGEVGPLLDSHSQKWSWVHNNYFTTEVLKKEHFEAELETVLSKYPEPQKALDELELSINQTISEKHKLIDELKLGDSERRLLEILDFHAWYQDYRKEYTMMVLHYLDLVLGEIAKRKGLNLRDIKWLLASEILGQADRLPDTELKKIIEERKKYAFFVWENEKFESFSGEDARKAEKKVLGPIKSSHEVIEIPGNIANKGKVQGIARVTMNSAEAKHLKKGEILITSMTSPDFISAIKKAAAIVTNEGGILCHAAIVSREFGIPCIVGTGIATKAIKDGALIEVDANHGFVRILKR